MRNEIVKNLSNDDYHAQDGLSSSKMGAILDCPARFYAEYLDPNKPEKQKKEEHFDLGSAVHTLVLEPEKFWLENHVMPKVDLRTTKGKELKAEHLAIAGNKRLINDELYATAQAMADSLFKGLDWLKPLLKDASIEESFFWVDDETGVQLKSRPDIYTGDMYIDIKTSQSASERSFFHSVIDYGYHRQAALAKEALMKLHKVKYNYFVHVVVEPVYPYLTNAFTMDDEFLIKGHDSFKAAAKKYKECLETGNWHGYGSNVKQLYCPSWL